MSKQVVIGIVIGMIGQKDAGKTTIATKLVSMLSALDNVAVESIGFSDPIYKMLAAFGLDENRLKFDKFYRHVPLAIFGGRTAYEMMLYFGQRGEFGQAINPNIYVDSAELRIDKFFESCDNSKAVRIAIVDNIRHQNEAEVIERLGGVIVAIHTHLELEHDNPAEMSIPQLQKEFAEFVIDNSNYPDDINDRMLPLFEAIQKKIDHV